MAYYVFLSIFPLLLALIAIFGFLVGTQRAEEQVLNFLNQVLPVSQDLIAQNVDAAIEARGFIGLASIVILMWSATGILSALTAALNLAWGVREGRPFFWQKLFELAIIVALAALLALSLVGAFLFQILRQIGQQIPGLQIDAFAPVLTILTTVLSFAFTYAMFLIVYKALPNANVRLSDIWLPALIPALAFDLAKNLFGWYIATFTDYRLVFGSLGAVIAFLFWAYLSALILLFGAELAGQYTVLKREVELAEFEAARALAVGSRDQEEVTQGSRPESPSPEREPHGHRAARLVVLVLVVVAAAVGAATRRFLRIGNR